MREKRIEEAERKKREKKEFRAQREKERQLREQLESETNPSTQPSSTQFVQRRSPSSPGETPILIPSISPETPHHQGN